MDFNLLLSVFFFFDVQIVPDVASGSLFEVILMSFWRDPFQQTCWEIGVCNVYTHTPLSIYS